MKTIYLTPHSHYDVVWAFNKEDYMYINEFILDKAIKMIKEDGFKFLIEQAYPLEQLEKRKPELFKDVAKAIAEDKLEIVDGLYIMPDLMIPGGETLVREILVGNGYVKRKFGKDIPVAYAADTFGLNAQMPQIYKKSGYKWLIFRRGLPKLIGRKVSEFIWEGLDGSQLISHWMPMGYRAGLELDKWEESVEKLSALATTSQIYMPCGSGGTPPQDEIPQRLIEWNEKHNDAKMVMATPREFFQSFEKEKRYLPTFKGELYSADLEDVFPDVVSSRISLKLDIKESENSLLLAEKLATLALLQGQPYPSDLLNGMWKKMLFLANHDVMPSCGIDEIYEEAKQYIAEINLGSREIMSESANFIVKEREDGGEICIAVFNPYNWTVTDWVEKKVELGDNWKEPPGIKMDGREIPSEIIHMARDASGNIKKATIGFMATVRPLNHNVYEVTKKKSSSQSIKVKDNDVRTKLGVN
jgi:alpha-mannosidase